MTAPLFPSAALCLAAFAAGLVDSVAGGGGLIQLPALLIFLPHATSTADVFGTNKLVGLVGTSAAAWNYGRRIPISWRTVLPAAGMGLISAACGAIAVSHLRPSVLRPLVLLMLVAVAIYTFVRKDFGSLHAPRHPPARQTIYGAAMGLLLGFYDGFFGPGMGSFLIFTLIGFFGFDFLAASAAAKVINTATNISAVAYFAIAGHVIYTLAIPMAACNLLGSFAGTHLAILRGSSFVRVFFLVIVTGIIAKLAYDLVQGG